MVERPQHHTSVLTLWSILRTNNYWAVNCMWEVTVSLRHRFTSQFWWALEPTVNSHQHTLPCSCSDCHTVSHSQIKSLLFWNKVITLYSVTVKLEGEKTGAGAVKIRQKQHAKLTILEISFLNKYVKMYNFSTLSLSLSLPACSLCTYTSFSLLAQLTFKSVNIITHIQNIYKVQRLEIFIQSQILQTVFHPDLHQIFSALLFCTQWTGHGMHIYVSWRIRHLIND